MFRMILFVPFLLLYILFFLVLLFSPFMSLADIIAVIEHEAPKENYYFALLFVISLILYLSMRVSLFRKIYLKMPVLWPLSQMVFIMLVGLSFGLFFMNLWAENAIISKTIAISLTVISILLVRVFMSYWYKKYPISVKMFK
ncbi:hypothetical protein LC087_04290 [Bacillus carboniphilus]|uniref:Uncharacterized protein n=1 Tax=Bacillus carboniphilus TaxID=86663 RepID=A0ABY9JVJ8_9BACI|nr:hypothetical protein [Bacillus carboniphilus]WLR43405.1 hypothetical protein LC087_04290 [Bacillus carboniphilus]